MRTSSVVGAVVLSVAVAGCGRGVSAEDRAAIGRAVTQGLNGTPVQQCRTAVTDRYATQLYGSVARCRRATTELGPDTDTHISVEDVEGRRPEVHARIRLAGGDFTGATGHLVVRRDQDGTWRLDDIEPDLLRSLLADPAVAQDRDDRRSRTCFRNATSGLGDAEFKRLALALLGARAHEVPDDVIACFPPRTGNLH